MKTMGQAAGQQRPYLINGDDVTGMGEHSAFRRGIGLRAQGREMSFPILRDRKISRSGCGTGPQGLYRSNRWSPKMVFDLFPS